MQLYISNYVGQSLSDYKTISEGIYVSKVTTLTLKDYCNARTIYCSSKHNLNCTRCNRLLQAAQIILDNTICSLSFVFKSVYPESTYNTETAKSRILQLPVVAIRIGSPSSGTSEIKVMEHMSGVDYVKLKTILSMNPKAGSTQPVMTKEEVRQILSFAQNRRERETVLYTFCKTAGVSATSARKIYGIENLDQRMKKVEEALEDAKSLRECIDSMVECQDDALTMSLGLMQVEEEQSGEESEDDSVEGGETGEVGCSDFNELLSLEETILLLQQCKWNWFEFLDRMEDKDGYCEEAMDVLYGRLLSSTTVQLSDHEKELLQQSYDAYVIDKEIRLPIDQKNADAFNGMIVSDSEVEDPEDYLEKNKERLKVVVARRREAIKRRGRYLKAKKLAEQKFLARRQCKRTDSIVHRYPDIGKVIEDFVEQRNIGADAWRRTGVLTFDGNTSVGKKVTFRRIQQHLQQVYNRSFSYGTVVQLCVPRNLRRKSAKLYKSVARVTCRRARKGFEMKYNPDRHWSAALYRNLNKVQYEDGRNIVNINRDDAAGYRLDTMTIHSLHRTHVVDNKQALTTHTDYVNRYPSILQTTSYNFSRTENTEEMCAGIVKSSGIFPKNPAQHACDLQMLQQTAEFSSMFVNPVSGEQKMIECIRVDGASDEGPSHEEVQFYWTERHLQRNLYATIVSARCSGSSYLNRVELQNGCLALGHANLFIPSTLSGSNMDPTTGGVNLEQYKKNMDLATEVYINRVSDSPCGGTAIKLYKGADSSDHQKRRPLLLKFLKGSKQDKRHLEQEHKQLYDYFSKIWKLRSDHMVKEYPVNYLFCLFACCGTSMCIHPLCQHHDINMVWYQGGPLVKHIPLPIRDKNRPWGNPECAECKGVCGGHFLKDVFESDSSPMVQPPSVILKKAFQSLKGALPTSEQIKKLAEECLLPIEEVTMWMDHLKQIANNRKRGATKAAETRKKKKAAQTEDVCCVVCHSPYVNFTEQVENWIQCDSCDSWTHFSCAGILESDKLPDTFYCSLCCEAT